MTKYGHVKGTIPGVDCCEAGHPVPDENGFAATRKALELVQGLTAEDTVLFLLSGGGSALFEKPLVPGAELQDITGQLLGCGADIVEMNTIRKRLSGVKGGRFAQRCAPAQVFSIVLSDILGDPLDMIASGPAAPDSSTCAQALAIAEKYRLNLSKQARTLLAQETPKALDNVTTRITGSVRALCTAAADACRKSMDGGKYDFERLSGIFSRGGLTDGYFTGSMQDMQGTRSREDVENSAKALNGIKALYKAEFPRIRADIRTILKPGEPAFAAASCGDISAAVQGEVPQPALNAPLTSEGVCSRMSKLGGTQFYAGEVTAEVGEGLNLPASALNSLRRELVEQLSAAVLAKNTPDYSLRELTPPLFGEHPAAPLKWRCEVYSAEQLRQALELPFELIYAPMRLLGLSTPDKDRIAVIPPFVLSDCEDEVRERLRELRAAGFTRGMAQTLGHALLLREEGFILHGGHRMNIINSYAAGVCGDFGFEDITLSFEGTAAQLAEIRSPIPRGVVAYGRLPLMIMRRCPVSGGKPCGRVRLFDDGGTPCGECIADRRGNKMPVLCGGNSVEILNPDLLIMSDRSSALEPFDFAVLKFTDEKELKPILDMYQNNGKPSGPLTRGLYFRGAE